MASKRQKLTAQQKSDRIKAAQQREECLKADRKRAEKTKKVMIIVVCIVLVIALSLPTMALLTMGG